MCHLAGGGGGGSGSGHSENALEWIPMINVSHLGRGNGIESVCVCVHTQRVVETKPKES